MRLLSKYKPETREEKKRRLMDNAQTRKDAAKLDDVDPIELACWLLRCAEKKKKCPLIASSECHLADCEKDRIMRCTDEVFLHR